MGKYIYGEWINIVCDYFAVLRKPEAIYEIVLPIFVAIIAASSYDCLSASLSALLKMRDLLPASLAILIGFTITCITILATSSANAINILKKEKTDGRVIRGRVITLYQWLLIMFSYALLLEVTLLIFVFFIAFILRQIVK